MWNVLITWGCNQSPSDDDKIDQDLNVKNFSQVFIGTPPSRIDSIPLDMDCQSSERALILKKFLVNGSLNLVSAAGQRAFDDTHLWIEKKQVALPDAFDFQIYTQPGLSEDVKTYYCWHCGRGTVCLL